MRAASSPSEFVAAPLGRYHLGPCFLAWCWDATLCGVFVWGRPSEEEVRALVASFAIEASLGPRFDVVTDSSRMSLVAPVAFGVLSDYLARAAKTLFPRIRKQALVTPGGLIGAAVAGLYPLLDAPVEWKPATSLADALAWLGTTAALAARGELEALISRAADRPKVLHALHEHLRSDLAQASIDTAALALRTSRRSLQRALTSAGTSFRDELLAARIEAARRRLAETDDKLESIAASLGFSSASHFSASFQAAAGEAPAQFRARHKR